MNVTKDTATMAYTRWASVLAVWI